MSGNVQRRGGGGLRLVDGVVLVAVGVVGVIVAFWVLGAVVGAIWVLVKIAVLVVLVAAVIWLLVGRRR